MYDPCEDQRVADHRRSDWATPFPFRAPDLHADRIGHGAQHTLECFYRWRDRNEARISSHIAMFTEQLQRARTGGPEHTSIRSRIAREVAYFGVFNLAEVIPAEKVAYIVDEVWDVYTQVPPEIAAEAQYDGPLGVVNVLQRLYPAVSDTPEAAWLDDRLRSLHRALPEDVVRTGAMGKVARTIAGVMAIGAYDTMECPIEERAAHLRRIVTGAYTYGAVYATIDDTLHDMARYGPPGERARVHELVEQTFARKGTVDFAAVPDHPLAEELYLLYERMLEVYPRDQLPVLYDAAYSMYVAQHRDSGRSLDSPEPIARIYPDVFVKAGLSRVIANLLGRQSVDGEFFTRCVNTTFLSQFNDDLRDRDEDAAGNRLTTFTAPWTPGDPNPLYDLFAYDAFVVDEIYGGSQAAEEVLTYFGAAKIARKLASHHGDMSELLRTYQAPAEIERFLMLASRPLPEHAEHVLRTFDTALKEDVGKAAARRDQGMLEVRTFVLDRVEYIDDVITRLILAERHRQEGSILDDVYIYTIGGDAKRVRPALTLMLAEALDVPYVHTEPLLAASELFHTASLILDDLPAQDDSPLRRGRPAAHVAFDEGAAQLAAVAMISSGFGMFARLRDYFPLDRVGDLVAYAGLTLGPERLCKGQALDLTASKQGQRLGVDELLELYRLKTSTLIEAALVPLLILVGRDDSEVDTMQTFAAHAGVVFQVRDDVLDATDGATANPNLVHLHGRRTAHDEMERHRQAALACCADLPFDTRLLEGAVSYFATRKR